MPTHAIIITDQPELIGVYRKTIELNDAQIKALPTTGIQIVAAPGVGKFIKIIGGVLRIVTTAPYDNITADETISIRPGGGHVFTVQNNVLTEADAISDFLSTETSTTNFTSSIENEPLRIFAENTDGNYTGGNAANTLTVTVIYAVCDVA